MQATKTAQIYGMIISNPGITCREITKTLDTTNVSHTIYRLVQRGVIKAVEGTGSRSTRYYKGGSPIVLRQAAGVRQKDIDAAAIKTAELRDLQAQVDWLQSELTAMRKSKKFKLAA